jgi:hypothetical protein
MNRSVGSLAVSDILQYNITSDTIQKVSSLSVPTEGGLALKSNDSKYIYHFGGWDARTAIHRFNPEIKATVKLSTLLPSEVFNAAGVTTSQSAFIVNGREENILEFDLATETVKEIGNLSFGNGKVLSTAIIPYSSFNRVWLFPASLGKLSNRVKMFNSETRVSSDPHQNISVPSLYYKPVTVSAGRYGYIIGGVGNVPEFVGSKHPSHGILR